MLFDYAAASLLTTTALTNSGSNLDDWLTVHCNITLVISNLMHKILIYLHIIHLLKSSTCFEHYPAHLQQVCVIVYMQPLVSSLSAGDCPVHRLTHWHTTFYNTWRTYIYIYIYIYGAPILDVSRSHTTTQQSR